jgi:dTDP-glucose pyrophosphorylase/galactokinase/mevalonate kinase-like predicted kinase
MPSLTARAQARIGLLGNPSDIYGGFGLGLAVRELGVTVTLTDAATTTLPNDLLRAGWDLMQDELRAASIDPRSRPFALTSTTNIPFQAGLSGSSALLVAALRAWSRWFAFPLDPRRVAELAWRAENERLGIRAGPLDRLVQAHDGLVAMDFAAPFAEGSLQRLDPALLPPLLVAWHGQPTQSSGDVHAPIWARFQAGDPHVRATMERLAANARQGQEALRIGDLTTLRACVDRNFDLRAGVFAIAPADRELIELGRSLGAATKFPGSGGAVLFACRDDAHRDAVDAACRAHDYTTLRPTVQPPRPRLFTVFLAAGFATRLYPLTLHTAKPLLHVGGQPMLTRILRQVEACGAASAGTVVANGRFHADFVRWHEQAGARLPLAVVNDGALTNETRLGAIRDLALGLAHAPHDVDGFLVLACDNLFEFDLGTLVDHFQESGIGQLVVREVPPPVPPGKYSEVVLDGDRVASFREKPADPRSNLSAIALYLLPRTLPALLGDYFAGGGNADAPGHFLAWLAQRAPLQANRLTGRFHDIGSADDLAAANAMR